MRLASDTLSTMLTLDENIELWTQKEIQKGKKKIVEICEGFISKSAKWLS